MALRWSADVLMVSAINIVLRWSTSRDAQKPKTTFVQSPRENEKRRFSHRQNTITPDYASSF